MIRKLLYLTCVNMDANPESGSSVRPLKMKEALESLGLELKTFSGPHNNISLRRRVVSEVKALLKTWTPDACYIEPPSGPFFYYGDVLLIRKLHRMGIPLSLFYRDAYWKYPSYSEERPLSVTDRLKRFVIQRMQAHQWKVFRENIDLLYFPSRTMAEEFTCPNKDTLPPGCFIPTMAEKTDLSNPPRFIFVGCAARNHGTFLTLDAFRALNQSGRAARLTYICRKDSWDKLGLDPKAYGDWLTVVHTSGDDNLRPYYEQADAALLTAPRTFYRDFAVPVKLFEYMSYLKPMLVTDCTETARVVRDNRVGWVVRDDVESVVRKLEELCGHPREILEARRHMEEARDRNLWIRRAEKVVRDLERIARGTGQAGGNG